MTLVAAPSADRDGDSDPTAGVRAVAGDLLVEVEATNPLAGLPGCVVQPIGWHDPGDLELQPVRILAVEALCRAVVRRAGECAVVGKGCRQLLHLRQRVDLPGQVVETDRCASRARRPGIGSDLEQTQVVVVGRSGCLQERRTGESLRRHVDSTESKYVGVEGHAALDLL